MEYFVYILIGIVFLTLLFVIYNLNRKVEILEGDSVKKDLLLTHIETAIETSFDKIKELDKDFIFEKDTELGFIYEFHKEVINLLKDYFEK